jgi:hypothetical protein
VFQASVILSDIDEAKQQQQQKSDFIGLAFNAAAKRTLLAHPRFD